MQYLWIATENKGNAMSNGFSVVFMFRHIRALN
uniref:Uncharacterized protein n=1 Tax=Arundo donax TaxID=35708 RepID=A0A0A9G1X8_ARUDO